MNGAPVDDATRAAVERTAAVLEKAGHVVEPIELPVTDQFAERLPAVLGRCSPNSRR